MAKKNKTPQILSVKLDKIVGGGQALGTLEDGRKAFVWGALPGETVNFQVSKKKSNYVEGVVTEVKTPTSDRQAPEDPDSYISTSPWQVMSFELEQATKLDLIKEAFDLHDVDLEKSLGGNELSIYTNNVRYGYRNKVEFSFWYDTETEDLSLAFFRRGTHGKISIDGTSLASDAINSRAKQILKVLNDHKITGRSLKTLLIRSDAKNNVAWQLYVKDEDFEAEKILADLNNDEFGEIIYSNPKSPASVITKKLTRDAKTLNDNILGVNFNYATEGFFQINLPVYEQALKDMKNWVPEDRPAIDMYSGVGTIGLTIGGEDVTLVEINEYAVREMRRNIDVLGIKAEAVLAASENALDYIVGDKTLILDPPRAGLHQAVIDRILEVKPERIVYLSCNPVTQARDVALLLDQYDISFQKGYNFFPATPHIENLIVLSLK